MASAQKSEHMLISERAVFNGQGTAQQQYDAFSNAELDRIHSARCPHGCGANTLRVHAYYERAIEGRGEAGRPLHHEALRPLADQRRQGFYKGKSVRGIRRSIGWGDGEEGFVRNLARSGRLV